LQAENHFLLNQIDHQVRMQTVLNCTLSVDQKQS